MIIILIAVGATYATDDSSSKLIDDSNDDFELDDSDDGFGDEDDDLDDSDDGYDSDDGFGDEDDDLDDSDDGFGDEDDDLDDSDDDLDDDEDYNESDYTDFEFLECEIILYLEKYGNCTDENWTESESFLNEYQIYLADPSNYTLNESAEGYETYLKIFDSITSTFGDYNLSDNETAYLKFLIIYYLNNYGNVSANYTWNESESFSNFTIMPKCLVSALSFFAKGSATQGFGFDRYSNLYGQFYVPLNNSDDVNQTANGNQTAVGNQTVADAQTSDNNVIIAILLLIFMFAVLIMV